ATLRSCTCEPHSSEAVVEVEAPLDLVFLGPDRTVTGRARAVIGIAGTEAAGRMALDVRYGMGTGSSEPRPGPQGPARRPAGPRGRGLHAGQAGPAPGVPPGSALPARDLRRPPRAPPGRPIPGNPGHPPVSGVRRERAPPARLRLRRRHEPGQRKSLRGGGGSVDGGRARRGLLRGRGLHRLLLEPPVRGLRGPHGRLTHSRARHTHPKATPTARKPDRHQTPTSKGE